MALSYDVFISYRRLDGSDLAQVLRHALEDRGYSVFLDVRDLPMGAFDESLVKVIKRTPDFMPILTPAALQSQHAEQDWFHKEVTLAISSRRNICPIACEGLDLTQLADLPLPVNQLRMHHTIVYSHDYCDAAVDRLCQMLTKSPRRRSHGIQFFWGVGNWRKTVTIGVSFLGIFLLAIALFSRQIKATFNRNTSALGGDEAKSAHAIDPKDSMGSFDSGKNGKTSN